MKKFKVTIELDAFEVNVSAKNATEAKNRAIETLKKKNNENDNTKATMHINIKETGFLFLF